MKSTQSPGMQLLMLVAILLCCQFLGDAIARIYVLSVTQNTDAVLSPQDILISAAVSHSIVHLLGFFVFIRISNLSFTELISVSRVNPFLWFIPVAGSALAILLAQFLSALSLNFFESMDMPAVLELEAQRIETMKPILVHNSIGQLILSLFSLAVLPAVGEELIYRGIVQSRLVKSTGNIHFSILISSLIFAALHLQPVNLLTIALLGLGLGYLYHYTRNILLSMSLHFLINAIQIIQVYLWPESLQ